MSSGAGPRGIEITGGLTESSDRSELRTVFGAFGPLDACWVVHGEDRHVGYLRFRQSHSAKAAADACSRGTVSLAKGPPLVCRLWARPQDQSVVEAPPEVAASRTEYGGGRRRSPSWGFKNRRKALCGESEKRGRSRSSGGSSSCFCVAQSTVRQCHTPLAARSARRGLLEVSNMPPNESSRALEYLLEILSHSIEMLPDYDGSKGAAVVKAWTHAPGVCRMELQSSRLVESTARVVDGIVLLGQTLMARVVPA